MDIVMNIVFLVLGLLIIYILWNIAQNQKIICKNQVAQTKDLLGMINELKGEPDAKQQ
jgi:hypothetical protein|tara:strand:+ start:103 stop:276 length:174 start_codon:yes stop_codon:yes gene_type:complete